MTAETTTPAAPPEAPPGGPQGIPAKPAVPAWRLVATLAIAGSLSALLLAFVYEQTRPAIERNKARVLQEAIAEVLGDPARVASLAVTPGGLEVEDDIVYAVDPKRQDRVFFGWDEAGRPIGFALVGARFGYGSDPIKLIFGYDAKDRRILGLKILEHKETPGIGTKIETDESFAGLFWKDADDPVPPRRTPLVGMRDDQFDPQEPQEIDMISGATISSVAVIEVVNEVTGALQERLEAWSPEEAR